MPIGKSEGPITQDWCASDWRVLQEVLYKCIDTIQYKVLVTRNHPLMEIPWKESYAQCGLFLIL